MITTVFILSSISVEKKQHLSLFSLQKGRFNRKMDFGYRTYLKSALSVKSNCLIDNDLNNTYRAKIK
jgi:hypothetical protein